MADNTHTGENSNYINMLTNAIGQQLFAYTYSGEILNNPAVTEKFKKSLIFLGKEGQIYNPLTGTYVGIGQTAYTNLSNYANKIEEKVDALNQALTSSMVSAIYANHDPNTEVFTYKGEGMSLDTYRGIHATNEIIFRGLGDYDPETGARTGKSFLNVTDANATATNQELLNTAYYVDSSMVGGPHATSGITVSLVKGANYYRFNFKGYNSDLHGVTAVGSDKAIVQNVFVGATSPEVVNGGKVGQTVDGSYQIDPAVVLDTDTSFNTAITQLCAYLLREVPATNDDKIKLFSEYYEAALDSKGETQLYKNGRNEFIIDDKLTWSYISSAYAYTLDFAQKFTQTEVNRIYSEILGLENGADLIPVNASVIKKVVADNNSYVFNTTTGVFELQGEDTTLLTDIVLNTDTKFYQKVYFNHVVNTTYKDVVSNSTDKDLTLEGDNKTSPITIRQYQLDSANARLVTGSTDGSVDVYNTINDVTTIGATKDGTIALSVDAQPANLGTWAQLNDGAYEYYLAPDKSGSQYSLDYFLKPVTSVDEVNENYDYVVVNTKSSSSHNINISDGINTLKEVAYVLDIITNGNLNPNDPESSGIEMAYSIAKNHVDILKLDERLVKVEGGLNVVNNISHSDAGDHKFATLNIESNKYKTINISSLSEEAVDNVIANAWSSEYEYILEKTVEGNTTYISLLDSVILSYQQAYNSYVIHKDNGNDELEEPVFADYCTNYDAANDKLYIVEKTKLASVDPQLTAYVGDVKLGVDLTLAYTYTCNEYSHNDGEGFVAITLNEIPNNNKKLTIDIAVPAKFGGLNASSIEANTSKYAAGDPLDENTTVAEIIALIENISGKSFTIPTDNRTFDASGKIIVENDPNCIVNISINADVKNVYAKVTSVTYNLVGSILTDKGFDGTLYSSNEGAGTVVANNSELSNNTVYYLRYATKETSIKFANTEVDGLASAEWVKAYTGQVVNDIKNDLAVANVNSYNYAASLLTKLDSNVKVETGEVIDTISIVDGKISVTSKELPTDKVVVMDVITGENGDTDHNEYVKVNDFKAIDLAKTSLYIEDGTRLKLHVATGADLADDTDVFDKNGIELEEHTDVVNDSYKFGKNYANYIPLYTKETAYKLIDNADLTFNADYSIASYQGTETSIYKISTQVVNTEYITAEFVHNDKLSGGDGGNTLHLTTHITKLVDASADNKGFADAYDVKQTLNNLFEWVDLDDLLDNMETQE